MNGFNLLDVIVASISLNVPLQERWSFLMSRNKPLEQLPFSASSTRPRCLSTAVNCETCFAILAIC